MHEGHSHIHEGEGGVKRSAALLTYMSEHNRKHARSFASSRTRLSIRDSMRRLH